jgi:hypothetical protein
VARFTIVPNFWPIQPVPAKRPCFGQKAGFSRFQPFTLLGEKLMNIMGCFVCRFVPVVVLGLAASSAAYGQTYANQVIAQLDRAQTTVARSGYRESHDAKIDYLNARETDTLRLSLDEGYTYKIIGACDTDCSDLDIRLYDENDNEIDKDIETDDVPIVEVTPQWTGTFRLKVKMHSCDSSDCAYGIGVYRKRE